MNIETYYPRDPILKKHIEYYYFLKSEGEDFSSTYYAFPNILQAFNIHHQAACDIDASSTHVYGSRDSGYLMIVQGRHPLPLYVSLRGKLDKVTIIFKPLGLNHFVDSPLYEITNQHSQVFTGWSDDPKCAPFLHAFYETSDYSERIELLEAYLLSRYKLLADEAMMGQAISLLCDFDSDHTMENIASKIGMNVRSFNRIFLRHLGVSPGGFKKIARFRHSLKNKILNDHFKSLTKVSYESNYYDQAYFNKIYKKMTGQNPLGFFKSIEKLADDQLIFQFVNK